MAHSSEAPSGLGRSFTFILVTTLPSGFAIRHSDFVILPHSPCPRNGGSRIFKPMCPMQNERRFCHTSVEMALVAVHAAAAGVTKTNDKCRWLKSPTNPHHSYLPTINCTTFFDINRCNIPPILRATYCFFRQACISIALSYSLEDLKLFHYLFIVTHAFK